MKRKKTRDRKVRDEKRRERKIQAEENKKMGNCELIDGLEWSIQFNLCTVLWRHCLNLAIRTHIH